MLPSTHSLGSRYWRIRKGTQLGLLTNRTKVELDPEHVDGVEDAHAEGLGGQRLSHKVLLAQLHKTPRLKHLHGQGLQGCQLPLCGCMGSMAWYLELQGLMNPATGDTMTSLRENKAYARAAA
jgi:hypothetical protein